MFCDHTHTCRGVPTNPRAPLSITPTWPLCLGKHVSVVEGGRLEDAIHYTLQNMHSHTQQTVECQDLFSEWPSLCVYLFVCLHVYKHFYAQRYMCQNPEAIIGNNNNINIIFIQGPHRNQQPLKLGNIISTLYSYKDHTANSNPRDTDTVGLPQDRPIATLAFNQTKRTSRLPLPCLCRTLGRLGQSVVFQSSLSDMFFWPTNPTNFVRQAR